MSRHFKVVLANGVFDVFHIGHLLHLEQAKKMGSLLVVSITHDDYVGKGPGRPIYRHGQRSALVRALKCVDEVIVVKSLISAMKIVRPDILVKGTDYKGGLDQEHQDYCKQYGIEIRYTDTPKYSATELIRGLRKN